MERIKELIKKYPQLAGGVIALAAFLIYKFITGRGEDESTGAVRTMAAAAPAPDGGDSGGGASDGGSAVLGQISDMFKGFMEVQAQRDDAAIKSFSEQIKSLNTSFSHNMENIMGIVVTNEKRQEDFMKSVNATMSRIVSQPSVPVPDYYVELPEERYTSVGSGGGNKKGSGSGLSASEVVNKVRETGKAVTGVDKETQKQIDKAAQEKQKAQRPDISFDRVSNPKL